MDLKDFLAIAGKPGLFKNIGSSKNGVIVESIPDGKKITAFTHERISSLAEISVFTTGEDIPLVDVFKKIHDAYEGKTAIDPNAGPKELAAFMEKVLPDYDPDRVYNSDIKKIVRWYNLLAENNLFDFTQVAEEENAGENKVSDNQSLAGTEEDDSTQEDSAATEKS
jgi:hypothetical protein